MAVRATIVNKKGLHARAAAKLVKTAAPFNARIMVKRVPRANDNLAEAMPIAGATSVLSLLMLGADRGCEVELSGEGEQAIEAMQAIVALIARKFDEDE